jgi:hypothetical protein
LAAGELRVGYGDEGRLVGALTVGQTDEVESQLKELIAGHASIGALDANLVRTGGLR